MAHILKRILCVDDETDILAVSKLALETVGGFETKQCSSGAEALIEVDAYRPDLILLDVMMPQMDGPATLRALRQNTASSGIPVIFMTAKVQPQEMAHYLTMGALGVVPKPFDPMTLAGQVREIWEKARKPAEKMQAGG